MIKKKKRENIPAERQGNWTQFKRSRVALQSSLKHLEVEKDQRRGQSSVKCPEYQVKVGLITKIVETILKM